MGTWAVDAFGNDDACDWAADLVKSKNLAPIEEAFSKIITVGEDYLDAPDAVEGLVAAEAVARLQGNFGEKNAYTEHVDAWAAKIKIKPNKSICENAHAIIDRILCEPSELLELWEETDDFDAWKESVLNLKSRISLSGGDAPEEKKGFFGKLFK